MLISTVLGRFTMAGSSGVAPRASSTRSQIMTAFSGSVPEKLSGEYSKRTRVSGWSRRSSWVRARMSFAPSTAIWVTPSMSVPKTTFRWRVEVEL